MTMMMTLMTLMMPEGGVADRAVVAFVVVVSVVCGRWRRRKQW